MAICKPTKRQVAEAVIIVLFVALFLSVHAGRVWDYKIKHEYPAYFNANDNFFHSELSDYVKERGKYDISPYYAFGGFTNVAGYLPPILYHLSASLSLLTGLETYDTTYMVVILIVVAGALLLYFSIRKLDNRLAIVSLPFMIGIFAMPFEIPYAWGLWIFLSGAIFFMAIFWFLSAEKTKYSFIILAIFLSGSALSHAPELIFSIGLIAVYVAVLYFSKRLNWDETKTIILSFIIFAAISVYYLIIFYFTYMSIQPFTLSVMEKPVFAPNFPVNIETFGYLQYLLILGILIAVLAMISGLELKTLSAKDKMPFLFLAAIYIFIIGFTNFFGFGVRAFQMRTLWPILLSIITALPIYAAFSFAKCLRLKYIVPISVILLFVFSSTYYGVQVGQGMTNKETWEAFKWIGNNTEMSAKVFWFYSLPMVQEFSFFSTKRIPFKVNIDEYADSVRSQVVKNTYNGSVVVLTDAKIPYSKSLLSYGYHIDEDLFKRLNNQNTNNMNYYVFGLANIDAVAINYNKMIISKMLEANKTSIVFSNNAIAILKNEEAGEK